MRLDGGLHLDVDIAGGALGACNLKVRGQPVPWPNQRFRAAPQKGLFFSLSEIKDEGGCKVEKSFQSFAFPNTTMTFPVPFVLNVESPNDCPRQLELYVVGSDHDGFHYEFPMRGWKKINLEKSEFESVIVFPPTF